VRLLTSVLASSCNFSTKSSSSISRRIDPASSELISRSSFSNCKALDPRSGSRKLLPREPILAGTGRAFPLGPSNAGGDGLGVNAGFGYGCESGEGNVDRPVSLTSALDDSAPGELTVFHPKNEVILLPGVLDCFESIEPEDDMIRKPFSKLSGGGLLPDFTVIVSDTAMEGSLTRREWTDIPFAACSPSLSRSRNVLDVSIWNGAKGDWPWGYLSGQKQSISLHNRHRSEFRSGSGMDHEELAQ
jgi:hypothetical protein